MIGGATLGLFTFLAEGSGSGSVALAGLNLSAADDRGQSAADPPVKLVASPSGEVAGSELLLVALASAADGTREDDETFSADADFTEHAIEAVDAAFAAVGI